MRYVHLKGGKKLLVHILDEGGGPICQEYFIALPGDTEYATAQDCPEGTVLCEHCRKANARRLEGIVQSLPCLDGVGVGKDAS